MSDVFNYDIVKQITNEDFASSHRGLLSDCEEIKLKYESGQYRDCCKAVRSKSESILRYIFERVVEYRRTPPMAGAILQDAKFGSKVSSSELIYSAGEVQRIGNKYSHEKPYPNETDEQSAARIKREEEILPVETKVILQHFSIVLEKGIDFINNEIPSIRGNLQIQFKQRINVNSGREENVLVANLTDVKDRRSYIYTWKIMGQERVFKENSSFLSLNKQWMEGKIIILEAKKDGMTQPLVDQYGPIKNEEILENPQRGMKQLQTLAGDKPNGDLSVEKNDSYKGAGVKLDVKLVNSDFNIDDSDVSVEWGFIGSDGRYIPITKDNGNKNISFKCYLNKNPFGKKYVCRVQRVGFSSPLEAEFRELAENDFAIQGIVELRFDQREGVLRAAVRNPNFNGQPEYRWFKNGEEVKNETNKSLKIGREDIGAVFECEICKKDELVGTRRVESPYIVKEDDFDFTENSETVYSLTLNIGEHEGDRTVFATINPQVFDISEYTYKWSVKQINGHVITKQYKGPHLALKGIKAGDTIYCEMVIPDPDICIKGELQVAEKDLGKPAKTIPSKPELLIEEPTLSPETSADDLILEPNPDPALESEPNGYTREIKLPYEMRRIGDTQEEFFTSTALVHYFVRPNDYFALNSFELVSADTYLYRLLKVSSFEYIYFVEVEGTECVIYAYDDAAQSAFPKDQNAQAEKRTLSGLNTIKKTTSKNSTSADVGVCLEQRRVRHFSTSEEFRMQFATAVRNALSDSKHKTAVVMPIRIFGKEGYCTDPVIDTLGSMVKNNDTENAMIITLPSKSDFLECFKTKQADIHDWINIVLDEVGTSNRERVGAAIDILLKQGRLLLADEYRTDEFANLLLRKRLIEKSEGLSGISSSKIYAVAELLRDYLMNDNTSAMFKSIRKFKGNILKELNNQLNKETVCEELVKKANRLSPVRVGYSRKLNPLQLERVYHEYYDRYENDNTTDEVMRQFNQFAGEETQEIISQIVGVVSFLADERIRIDEQRRNDNYSEEMPYMNMVFWGNPGTGKTTIAKLTAKYMKAMGVLPSDRFEYITASAETEGIVGNTAANIRIAAQRAVGGVLLIDEFQGFEQAYHGGNVAKNALEAIVSVINSHRDDLCIIIAGYKDGVETVLKHDQGADRRFPENNRFLFKDFSSDTLLEILHNLIERRGEKIEDGADEILKTVIENKIHDEARNFGNAGYIETELLPALEIAKSKREKGSKIITIEDINAAYPNVKRVKLSKEEILRKFDALIGDEMQTVKNEIIESTAVFKDAQNSIKAMKERGESPDEDDMPYMNMIFAGGPGTGKTTVAKLTAKYLREEGILPTDKYVYITATQEVEGRLGETEKKLQEAERNAEGGVLFIDEFQGFDKGHSNGNLAQDAMGAIVGIVNRHREDMCIILAGYQQGVDKVLRFDVGAKRRFPNRINFKDYSVDTLMLILESRLEKMKWGMEEDAKPLVRTVIEQHKKDSAGSFGNGGYIKDELLPMLNRKRLKRTDNNGVFIKQDVIDAFPEILGGKNAEEAWKPRRIPRNEMVSIKAPYELCERKPEELQKITDDAILYVTTDHGQGTAFLIHPDGYALTCNHVIRDSKEINARVRIKGRAGGDDSTHKCTLINAREDLDMAVIKLEGSNFPYIPLAQKSRGIRKGEGFILSGYPFGKRTAKGMTTYPGTIATSGEHTDKSDLTTYFISGEAKSGNSGSPIISLTDGLVIGILSGSLDEKSTTTKTEEINYMRPAYYFWEEFVK